MFEQFKLYILLAGAAAISIASATGAWKVQNWRYAAMENTRIEQERETAVLRRKSANDASTAHEDDKVRIQTKYITIEKEVERVNNKIEYRDRACFDDDGVRVINAAIGTTNAASEPSNRVPPAR